MKVKATIVLHMTAPLLRLFPAKLRNRHHLVVICSSSPSTEFRPRLLSASVSADCGLTRYSIASQMRTLLRCY